MKASDIIPSNEWRFWAMGVCVCGLGLGTIRCPDNETAVMVAAALNEQADREVAEATKTEREV